MYFKSVPCHCKSLSARIAIELIAKGFFYCHADRNSQAIKNDLGRTIKTYGANQDITDLRRAEEENKKLQAQLQQAQKMEAIGTLAGGIAHDFNNILEAILGYAEMAKDASQEGSVLAHDLDQVIKASTRAKELVKQILAFSRQSETERIPVQPAVIIEETIKMLRSSIPSTIDIRQEIDLDSAYILADPTQLQQIVVNLCTNAFHAMERTGGSLTLSLRKTPLSPSELSSELHLPPGDYLEMSFIDTGAGMTKDVMEKMFQPYFTTKEVGKGTDMGLANQPPGRVPTITITMWFFPRKFCKADA